MLRGFSLVKRIGGIQFLFLLSFTVLSQISIAQGNKKVDSLVQLLSVSKQDTSRVKILNKLSWDLLNIGDFEPAMKYAEEALALSEKLSFSDGAYYAYMRMGNIFMFLGNSEQSLKKFLLAHKIATQTGNTKKKAQVLVGIGNFFYQQGKHTEALENYSQGLKLWQQLGDNKEIAGTYVNMANIYGEQGNEIVAMERYLDALKTYEASGNKLEVAKCYSNIGLLFFDKRNFTEAIKYTSLSLKIEKELGDKYGMAMDHNALGDSYRELKNYTEALMHHTESLKLREEIGDKGGQAQTNYNIGNIYCEQLNYADARTMYLAVIELGKELNSDLSLAYANLGLCRVYLEENKMTQARNHAISGLSLATKINSVGIMKDLYLKLSEIDSAQKNFKSAYWHYKKYVELQGSVFDEEKERKITQLSMRYEFSKKEDSLKFQQGLIDAKLKQQVLLTYQQKKAKNYFIAGLVMFTILLFFLYRNYRTRQKLKLQTLRNKIASDLHDDVGSTLSSISIFSQMAQEQSSEVQPLLQTIGESSRKMLDAMADIVWTINPENDQFEKIILRMRSFAYELLGAKQIEFRFVADSNIAGIKLPMDARRNLYLIFKEATNNMVKYANPSRAMFSIKEEQGKLVMFINDNGKGFDSNKEVQGNGLRNMRKRASEMGAVLMIDSILGSGTTIKLELAV